MYTNLPCDGDTIKKMQAKLRLWTVLGCIGLALSFSLLILVAVTLNYTTNMSSLPLSPNPNPNLLPSTPSSSSSIDLSSLGITTFLLTLNNSSPNTLTNLSLYNNNLTSFTYFSFFDLESLNIDKNPIRIFSKNILTNMVSFDGGQQDSIEIFTDNHMPNFTGPLGFVSSNIKNFTNNNLSSLTSLSFQSTTLQQLRSNNFDGLISLTIITSSLPWMWLYAPSLQMIYINDCPSFESFSHFDLPNLTSLQLFNTNLTSFTNNTLMELQKLTIRNHQDGRFLNDWRYNLFVKLSELDLSENNFTGFEVEMFFKSNLRRLVMENNNMSSIAGSWIFLEECYLGNNQIMNLTGLGELPALKKLDASRNRLKLLGNFSAPGLTNLTLSQNHLTDSVVQEIINQRFTNITYISLKGNLIQNPSSAVAALKQAYPDAIVYI